MKVIKGRCLQSENTVAQMQRLAGSLGTGIMAGFAAGKRCPPRCVVIGKSGAMLLGVTPSSWCW